MSERTERPLEDWSVSHESFYWICPECDVEMGGYHTEGLDRGIMRTCDCGYQWMVEIRPRFYVVRD